MGVTKTVLGSGNGKDYPKKGDTVTIEYTGNLHDTKVSADNHHRGTQYVDSKLSMSSCMTLSLLYRFDTSAGRGDFQTAIGVGKVIKGIQLPQKYLRGKV